MEHDSNELRAREAAERRQQAAREGRDVQPGTKPDAGRVER